MEQADFDRLVKQLGSNYRCMLVLGPEFINIDSKEVDFTESIQDYLAKKNFPDSDEKYYIREDGFLFFGNESSLSFNTLDNLGDFFENLPLTRSYELLARIPFSSIISLSPDDLIVQAYKKINKPFTYCKFKGQAGFQDAPQESTKVKPMIYNLMGDYGNREDLVFTFKNFFLFLDKLFQDTLALNNLKAHIAQANNFLFLGFNFHKWYLKLFFYFLNKSRGNSNQFQDAIFNYKKKEDKFQSKIEYYKSSYNLTISPEDEREFIQAIYDACEKKGILSEILQPDDNGIESAKHKTYSIQFFGAAPERRIYTKTGDKFVSIMKILDGGDYKLLEPVLNLKQGEIGPLIDKRKPNLVYFNCHGTVDGKLILTFGDNTADYLPIDELKEIIDTVLINEKNKQIECIVFSVCKSEIQARQLSSSIRYCIGMCDFIEVDASTVFTVGFFEALMQDQQNIVHAFNMGVLALKTSNNPAYRALSRIPVLYVGGKKYEKQEFRSTVAEN